MTKSSFTKAIFKAAFLLFAVTSFATQAADKKSDKVNGARSQVVFQVSDDDAKKWNLALNNAKNVQQELGDKNVDVEIVVYGPGIGMLKFESTVAARIDEAIKAGVKVVACENTMKVQKLTTADMLTTISYVPAGVVELMKKQKEGYTYIRP